MRQPSCSRSTVQPVWRRLALAAACALTLASFSAVASTEDEASHEIKAPHYGDTLFQFFQAKYFTSITTLMTSQHFDRVAPHADEAEVLRGGMLLNYGLHREAGEIFAKLIDKGASPAVRDRAWFYLAKIRYQRGLVKEADEALSHISQPLSAELEEERGLLHANVLMARGDYAGAAAALSVMATQAPDARYVRFNLGIAQIKSGDAAAGAAQLDVIGQGQAESEEYRALRDKANIALGFAALADNRAPAARAYLARVRLNGPQANKALLGYGWAADAMNDHMQALVPWSELVDRNANDSAVLEARIAVPYAYASLGAYGQALRHYQDAINVFERESESLDASMDVIRSGKLVEAMLARNPGEEMSVAWQLDDLPELPHAAHLTALMAQHDFQESFKNLRDLRYLSANLQAWRDKLDTFNDMLDTRRKAFADRLPQVRARASGEGLAQLRQRFDAAAADVAQGEEKQDGVAFADAKQRDLLERVARAQAITRQAQGVPDIAQARDRVRLAAGALSWQLAQDYPARLWQARKGLQDISEQLVEAQKRDAALAQAQHDEPEHFDQFDRRIKAMVPMLDAMIPKVAALSQEQQTAMQELAVAELTRQRERLIDYTTQARFAVAQLYDRANVGRIMGINPSPSTNSTSKGAADAPKP